MKKNIWYLYIGFFLVKTGSLLGICARGPFHAAWFDQKTRIVALSITQMVIFLGYGANGLILKHFVNNKGDLTAKQIDDGVHKYLWTLFYICIACLGSSLLILRDKPKPSEDWNKKETDTTTSDQILGNDNISLANQSV